jgi:hypothetical protein
MTQITSEKVFEFTFFCYIFQIVVQVLWRTKNFERLVIPLTYKCKTGFMVN